MGDTASYLSVFFPTYAKSFIFCLTSPTPSQSTDFTSLILEWSVWPGSLWRLVEDGSGVGGNAAASCGSWLVPPENECLFFLHLCRYLAEIPWKIMILHTEKKGAIVLRPRKKVIWFIFQKSNILVLYWDMNSLFALTSIKNLSEETSLAIQCLKTLPSNVVGCGFDPWSGQ